MALRAQRSVSINAPTAKVFEYVADFTRHKEWGQHTVDIRPESPGPIGVGSTLAHQGRQFGTHADRITITEYVPGSRLAFESQGDAGHIHHWFDVRDEGGGCTLIKGFESVSLKGPLKLLAPFVGMTLPKGLDRDLRGIKARVEGSAR